MSAARRRRKVALRIARERLEAELRSSDVYRALAGTMCLPRRRYIANFVKALDEAKRSTKQIVLFDEA